MDLEIKIIEYIVYYNAQTVTRFLKHHNYAHTYVCVHQGKSYRSKSNFKMSL